MLENGSPNNPTMRPFIKEGTITGRDAEKIAAYIYHINQKLLLSLQHKGGAAPQERRSEMGKRKQLNYYYLSYKPCHAPSTLLTFEFHFC